MGWKEKFKEWWTAPMGESGIRGVLRMSSEEFTEAMCEEAYRSGWKARGKYIEEIALRFRAGWKADKWISVEDELPKKAGWYQVYINAYWTGERYDTAYFGDEKRWHDKVSRYSITHWQPLPEPPEDA